MLPQLVFPPWTEEYEPHRANLRVKTPDSRAFCWVQWPTFGQMTTLRHATAVPKTTTAVDVAVFSDGIDQLSDDHAEAARLQGFEGKLGQTLVLVSSSGARAEVLVGLGPQAKLTADGARRAAAAFVRAIPRHKQAALTMASVVSTSSAPAEITFEVALQAVTEGAGLATYSYSEFRGTGSKVSPTVEKVAIVGSGKGAKAAVTTGIAMVAAVSLARDLVNEPGGSLVPTAFVQRARDATASATSLKISVWDEKRIAREKLGGLIAVNKGSTNPARLLQISYTPAKKASGSVALVGKGITFDSGGLSIKSGTGMMSMKIDMAGAAAVLGAMTLLPLLNVTNSVTAWIPLTDNMINGDATRPGDVFTARNGKTVEVLNTDAEGRLVMADALSLAAEKKPDVIVDIATLTGAVTAALGPKIVGVMGSDDRVIQEILTAAGRVGEQVWHLPLPQEYRKQLDSTVADLRNIGTGGHGGALTAGLFLKEFVGDVPWGHLDVGISAVSDAEDGYVVKGATGVGVRLLANFAKNWTAEG